MLEFDILPTIIIVAAAFSTWCKSSQHALIRCIIVSKGIVTNTAYTTTAGNDGWAAGRVTSIQLRNENSYLFKL